MTRGYFFGMYFWMCFLKNLGHTYRDLEKQAIRASWDKLQQLLVSNTAGFAVQGWLLLGKVMGAPPINRPRKQICCWSRSYRDGSQALLFFGAFPRGQWGNWAIITMSFVSPPKEHDWYWSLFTSQLLFEAFIIAAAWGWQHVRYQGEVALVLLTHVIACVVSCCGSSRTLLIPVLLDWNLENSSGISNGCFSLCFKNRMRPCFWMVFIVDSYSMNGSYQWIVHSNGKPSKTTVKYGQTAKPMRFCSIHQ